MHSTLSGPVTPPRSLGTPGQMVIVERLRARARILGARAARDNPEITHRPACSSATLYRSQDRLMGSSLPLFDPQIIKWDSGGLILQGWESSENGAQYRQAWLVTFPVQTSAQ